MIVDLSQVWCLAVRDGRVLAGGRDGSLKLFDAARSLPGKPWPRRASPVSCVALGPDGELAASGTYDGRVFLHLPTGEVVEAPVAHGDRVESVTFGPGGHVLATGSRDQTVRLWQWIDAALVEVLTLPSPTGAVITVRFSPDGRKLAVLVDGEWAVRIWHLDRLKERLAPLNLGW